MDLEQYETADRILGFAMLLKQVKKATIYKKVRLIHLLIALAAIVFIILHILTVSE